MQNSLFANILFLLSLFELAVIAAPGKHTAELEARQINIQMNQIPTNQCVDYSRTANLSTIGANSTYRSAFIQASPVGTLFNKRMLDAAVVKLPALTKDRVLNQVCGNLTTVALVESERNYTMGIVAQFSGLVGNPQEMRNGPGLIPIVGFILVGFTAVWTFMP